MSHPNLEPRGSPDLVLPDNVRRLLQQVVTDVNARIETKTALETCAERMLESGGPEKLEQFWRHTEEDLTNDLRRIRTENRRKAFTVVWSGLPAIVAAGKLLLVAFAGVG